MRPWAALLLAAACGDACAQWLALQNGRLQGQYLLGSYPDDSLFREQVGTPTHDLNGELRAILGGGENRWRWQADYQLILRSGDTLPLGSSLGGGLFTPRRVQDDDRRLLDLTRVISEGDQRVLVHRLDRLHLGYTGDKAVLRLGRQAVSWGNGLIYNPVDFFNPFDPAAIDTEFKAGDDMLYGQYLENSGNDWQLVSVWRRNAEGDVDTDVNTHALKYHAFVGERELDMLLARHYRDDVASVGGISNLGGAVLRGDLMYTGTATDDYLSGVVNLSYSWVWWQKNFSGVLEYFYNDLGLDEADYDELIESPDLLARLGRGELFTVGRHYLAGSLTVELHPLFRLLPNLFLNAGDRSGLLQVLGQYDATQDLQLTVAASLPFGDDGTEFGGLEIPGSDRLLSIGPALFAQLNWYF